MGYDSLVYRNVKKRIFLGINKIIIVNLHVLYCITLYWVTQISVCLQQLCLLAFATVKIQEPRCSDGHIKNDDTDTMD